MPSVISRIRREPSSPDPCRASTTCRERSGSLGRQVHADEQRLLAVARPLPVADPATGLRQHPPAQRKDQPGLLGQRNELDGAQQAPRRVLPPDQGLDADHALRGQLEDRLEVEDQLLALDGPAELAPRPHRRQLGAVRRLVEHFVPRLAGALGRAHRDLGHPQELPGRHRAGTLHRDPDARARGQLDVLSMHGVAQCGQDAVRDGLGVGPGHEVRDQDGEVVGPQPRREARGRQAPHHPVGRRGQHGVADGVAVGVVDLLQVVEVDEQDGEPGALAARALQRAQDLAVEVGTRGHPGQGVRSDHVRTGRLGRRIRCGTHEGGIGPRNGTGAGESPQCFRRFRSRCAAGLVSRPGKLEARGTSGSLPTEAGCHLRPLGPSAPSNLSRLSRFPYDRPFRWALGRPEPPHMHS
jgi:hypothetical protein